MKRTLIANTALISSIISSLAFIGLPGATLALEDGEVRIDDQALAQEVKLIEDGSYSKARVSIEKLRAERPDDINVRLLAARLFRKIGLWSPSIMEYEHVRSKQPDLLEPYIALSEMHRENLSVDIALGMAREAVYISPHSVRAREALISALIDNHNVQLAQNELTELTKLKPEDPDVLYLSFKVYKGIGEPDKARQYLERAVRISPDNVAWLFDLAEIYEDTGDYKLARGAIQKYIDAAPDSTRALSKLAEILEFRLFDLEGAKEIYDRMLTIEPDNQSALAGKERLVKKRNDVAAAIKRTIHKFVSYIMSLFGGEKRTAV
ncbi:MAG: tetratricopeptide repeat protein [Candidatus Melainabacteria bacterium]|nr:tetratricopeptide repeat protein [Candidatus Melainabacteria bacterium]